MTPDWDARRLSHRGPYQRDSSGSTLVALLAVMAAPIVLVALVTGWRPPDPRDAAWVRSWWPGDTSTAAVVAQPTAAAPTDWALPDGWFYSPTGARDASGDILGFAVTDAEGIGFWSEHQRLGGTTYLGYPISRRFTVDEAVLQVFQRGALRYDPADGQLTVVRLLDRLHAAEHDSVLATRWGIPEVELPVPDAPRQELLDERLAWVLRDFPALAEYVAAVPDSAAQLGLATSTVHDVGSYYAIRFQAGALQQWKQDVPWAKTGEVTAANVGQIAAELGLFPAEALEPTAAAPPAPAAESAG